MKKIALLLMCASTLLITACSSTRTYSDQELQEQYKIAFQKTITALNELFSDVPEHTQTITDLALTFSQTQGLQGGATYSSASIRQGDNDHTVHTIFSDLLNKKDNLPILFTGEIITTYQDELLYVMIRDFDLFMGGGNIEINFINLLAKQLGNKRILVDDPQKSPIGVINTPQIPEILDWLQTAYTHTSSEEEQLFASQKLFRDNSRVPVAFCVMRFAIENTPIFFQPFV